MVIDFVLILTRFASALKTFTLVKVTLIFKSLPVLLIVRTVLSLVPVCYDKLKVLTFTIETFGAINLMLLLGFTTTLFTLVRILKLLRFDSVIVLFD